ncbi:GntR family transcriptional regulator [Cryptosporangium sp. NPDC048952]|uniref:GntR family transcriptional regulator n=1 Tax=Cryptosporangium sp. NPDC048952 TaxID=3363961 RepID=UPI00371FCB56
MTPSARITAELRERIHTGHLAPGDRLPSTRQITRQWGVAMATATKVLTALRQEGLVEAVPGVGTVVRAAQTGELPPPGLSTEARPAPRRPRENSLSRERIVDAAIRIADADGMPELSMRRVAAELGVATMALYRYVPSKDDLIILMIDAVFGTVAMIPEPQPVGWRARLEAIARIQWDVYRAHPWMAAELSFSRPQLVPRGMVHTEYAMATLHEAGLEPADFLNAAVSLFNHVRSMAMVFAEEQRNVQETGLSAEEWMKSHDSYFFEVMATGQFPMMSLVSGIPDDVLSIESLFEFGLARYLDGLEVLVSAR